MTSFGYRSNPRYAIKECSSCGTLYTRDCGCSKRNVEDKILVPKPPKNCARYVLRDEEAYKRCTCVKCRSGLGKGLCYICGHNQNCLNDSPSISETSSQSPPNINQCCYECGDPLDSIFCKQCTSESPFTLDSTPTYVDESPNVFNPPPQSFVCPWEFCGNDAYHGYYCTPQAPFIYPEPCYNQDFNFPQDFQNVPQQYLCCARCGGPHETCQCDQLIFDEPYCKHYGGPHMNYQCQPMNQDSYNSNSLDFDQPQSPQSPVIHQPPQELSIHEMEDLKQRYLGELKRLSNLEYRDEIKIAELTENFNDLFEDLSESNEEFSSTDDNSFSFDKIDYVEASPPDSELVSSEVMKIVTPKVGGIEASNDNHIPFYDPIIFGTPLNLTPSGESDFFLEVDEFLAVEDEPTSSQFPKSYLDPEGDMLLLEAFLNDDHSSDFKTNDDQSCSDEDVLEKIVSKPLCEEEIIPMKSLRSYDSSLRISSKIDSLLEEFAGELTLLKSIPLGIDETDCDFEEDIRLIEKLLYDNSSPRPLEEFVSANFDAKIKSFSPSPILVKDSDFLMKKIDLFCTPDYPMPPGIVDKDYDSERDILILKDLPSNNTLSFAEKESFHFDIPPFSRPLAKPPDGDTGILNIKMMGDIYDQKAFMHKLMITLDPHKEKSPDLLSHRCGTVTKFNTHRSHLNKCPMMIHGQNNPPLDVKETQEKDKIKSKPDQNGKCGEAGKIQKQLQLVEEEKLKKMQKEGPEMQIMQALFKKFQVQRLFLQFDER
nr:hypothetical protein [Tanacetum cinerariifolium]